MMTSWKIFQGTPEQPHDGIKHLPKPPSWRDFSNSKEQRGATYKPRGEEIDLVNAALYLRRPLLVTGKPGTGKTSLAYAVAKELQLGEVLRWNITTRSTLQEGLYRYDAIGRLQDAQGKDNLSEIGKYIQLGSLGTAFISTDRPRVLIIDEIDKSDIDLPNDLLNIFEEGWFEIPELARIADRLPPEVTVRTSDQKYAKITLGNVKCGAFPLVILTSNGEREFPPAFLRRCLCLDLKEPNKDELTAIAIAHLGEDIVEKAEDIIEIFLKRRDKGQLATDQLLNAIYLLSGEKSPSDSKREELVEKILQYLTYSEER